MFLYMHHIHWAVVPLMFVHCWEASYRWLVLTFLAVAIFYNYFVEWYTSWTASTCKNSHTTTDAFITAHCGGSWQYHCWR